ncbi:hypothetical protein DL764_003385 [Monosporascus ibericus]|uniref:Uncharacterized protein n=1 Tax=Monosporascus ibericus TaxID=155417 RepID=A0A4Q4TGU5_9PEZI|nr:hypothetical protein DL764_003385 [Monosporascus ibericus]
MHSSAGSSKVTLLGADERVPEPAAAPIHNGGNRPDQAPGQQPADPERGEERAADAETLAAKRLLIDGYDGAQSWLPLSVVAERADDGAERPQIVGVARRADRDDTQIQQLHELDPEDPSCCAVGVVQDRVPLRCGLS